MREDLKKTSLIVFVSFFGLLLAGLYLRFSFQGWQRNFPETEPLAPLISDNEAGQEILTKKELFSPDGKFRFEYSADWQESDPKLLLGLISAEAQKIINPFFFAQKLSPEDFSFMTLMAEEVILAEGEEPEKIIELINQYHQQGRVENLKIESRENKIYFEGTLEQAFGYNFSLVGALFPGREKLYLLLFNVLGRNGFEAEQEIKKIFDSAKVME